MKSIEARRLTSALPEVEVPEGLAGAIDARLETVSRIQNATDPGPGQWRVWALLFAGGLIFLSIQLYSLLAGDFEINFISPALQYWVGRIPGLPDANVSNYTLAVGLLLYIAGLFKLS